jgi:hypothetical protein
MSHRNDTEAAAGALCSALACASICRISYRPDAMTDAAVGFVWMVVGEEKEKWRSAAGARLVASLPRPRRGIASCKSRTLLPCTFLA